MCYPHHNHSMSPNLFVSGSPDLGGIFFHFHPHFLPSYPTYPSCFYVSLCPACLSCSVDLQAFAFCCLNLCIFCLTCRAIERWSVSPDTCSSWSVRAMIYPCPYMPQETKQSNLVFMCLMSSTWLKLTESSPPKYLVCNTKQGGISALSIGLSQGRHFIIILCASCLEFWIINVEESMNFVDFLKLLLHMLVVHRDYFSMFSLLLYYPG